MSVQQQRDQRTQAGTQSNHQAIGNGDAQPVDALAEADRPESPRKAKTESSIKRGSRRLAEQNFPLRNAYQDNRQRHNETRDNNKQQPRVLPFPAGLEPHGRSKQSVKRAG